MCGIQFAYRALQKGYTSKYQCLNAPPSEFSHLICWRALFVLSRFLGNQVGVQACEIKHSGAEVGFLLITDHSTSNFNRGSRFICTRLLKGECLHVMSSSHFPFWNAYTFRAISVPPHEGKYQQTWVTLGFVHAHHFFFKKGGLKIHEPEKNAICDVKGKPIYLAALPLQAKLSCLCQCDPSQLSKWQIRLWR